MKIPVFEDGINTVQDLVKYNITIFKPIYLFDNHRDEYLRLNISEWDSVANSMISTEECYYQTQICADINGTWDYYIKHHLHGNKTHAMIQGYLYPEDLENTPDKKKWWRSEKILTFWNPYASSMTSRNWIMNEVYSNSLF